MKFLGIDVRENGEYIVNLWQDNRWIRIPWKDWEKLAAEVDKAHTEKLMEE